MTQGLVNILLTSFNRSKYIGQAIESVLNQSYQNFELFILDDNSNQETQDVIQKYLDNPKVKFYNSQVSEENRGNRGCPYALNINYGIDNTDGEFITYLTDDDYFMPKRLQLMVDYLNSHPEVFVVYGRQSMVDANGNQTSVRMPDSILNSAAHSIDHNSVLHRRSIIEKTGKWPISDWRCGDAAFWNQITNAGYLFYPIKEVTDCKRYHSETLSAKMDRGEDLLNGITQ